MILEPIEFMGLNFYSRASARRDKRHQRNQCDQDISTHAPLRGATAPEPAGTKSGAFLLTRLCEARLGARLAIIEIGVFLLTRLCEARPFCPQCDYSFGAISTHAPLRGATGVLYGFFSLAVFLLTRLCEARPSSTWQL